MSGAKLDYTTSVEKDVVHVLLCDTIESVSPDALSAMFMAPFGFYLCYLQSSSCCCLSEVEVQVRNLYWTCGVLYAPATRQKFANFDMLSLRAQFTPSVILIKGKSTSTLHLEHILSIVELSQTTTA